MISCCLTRSIYWSMSFFLSIGSNTDTVSNLIPCSTVLVEMIKITFDGIYLLHWTNFRCTPRVKISKYFQVPESIGGRARNFFQVPSSDLPLGWNFGGRRGPRRHETCQYQNVRSERNMRWSGRWLEDPRSHSPGHLITGYPKKRDASYSRYR